MSKSSISYFRIIPAKDYSFIGYYTYRRQQDDFSSSFQREASKLLKNLEELQNDDSEEIKAAATELRQKFKDHRRQYLKVRLFWDDIESTLMGSGLESDKMNIARTIARGTTTAVTTVLEDANNKLKSGTKRSLDTIEDSQECCGLHSSEDGKGMACNDIFHVHEVELETSKTSVQVDDTISLKWEFDLPMPSWLTKAAKLRSNTPQSEAATKALCWRIIDVSDSAIVSEFSSSEFEELNAVFASALNNGNPKEDLMVVETLPESYLQMLGKLDSNQLKSIGNLVKIEGIRGALCEAQKLVGTKKKDQILFEDEVSTSPSPADMKEEDCTHDDVGYIFELLRYTCEWISESVASRHNSERDIDMFVKSHIFSCLKGVADQHFGEMVSRASRNRKASALDSPDNAEGFHVDWMFTRHDLSNKSWGQEFSMCERAGSKPDNKAKIDSDTLKLQKTLRDMHKALLKDISTAGGGAVTKPVLKAFTKLIMPGFVSSFFFIRVILVVYVGAGFYASRQMAEFNIPTTYDQLEGFIDVARAMLRTKNIMRNTISWFKAIKARAEREQFESARIQVDNGPPEFATPSKKRISRKLSTETTSKPSLFADEEKNPFL
ncbi:hypothetical protein G9A89_011353 [Geosiphon pyriformis]|nr:hypothetical protein G9A89_011353 [Geosiphon pyriformis]